MRASRWCARLGFRAPARIGAVGLAAKPICFSCRASTCRIATARHSSGSSRAGFARSSATLLRCDVIDGQPLVSAIIIFYNGAKYLDEAIASIFAQTYPRWELLLVDDGSTDAST